MKKMSYFNPSVPPPGSLMPDAGWDQTFNSIIQQNFNPSFVPPGFNEGALEFNMQRNLNNHLSHDQDERSRRERDDQGNRRRLGGRDGDVRRRSRFDRSRSPPIRLNNNVRQEESPKLNKIAEIKQHQSIGFGNVPFGNLFAGPVMNAMGGMMIEPILMGLPMANQIPVMPDQAKNDTPSAVNQPAAKGILALKSCTLLPPVSSEPPLLRDKPPGCKTIFVGGLIEDIKESVVYEIFERFGEITSVRLSKKNFCHIRFKDEESVDAAVQLSGYRMRIDEKDSDGNLKPVSSWLHVDYALARKDQQDHKMKQREEKEKSHRRSNSPPSSPPVIHGFTNAEADVISDRLKQEQSCVRSMQILATWLERGDCNKKNMNIFYSLIQSTNAHVRRLLSEKAIQEETLERVKESVRNKMQEILQEFSQVERVFNAASHKKVWDHFSKAQRKNIEMWKKQSMEIRSIQLEEFMAETLGADEMDCSDDDDTNKDKDMVNGQLKQENESLQCQLDAYNNEIGILQKEADTLRFQVSELQRRLEGKPSIAPTLPASVKMEEGARDSKADVKLLPGDNRAKLIGLISTFLHIHPFGASSDYIWSYVQKILPSIKPNEVENVLRDFPNVFLQKISGYGANIERKWIFSGFVFTVK